MLQEEDAVEVVDFMAEGTGKEILAANFENLAFGILSFDGHKLRADDIAAESGNGEATFLFAIFAFGMNDFGIGENNLGLGVFPAGDVDHGEAHALSNLWS